MHHGLRTFIFPIMGKMLWFFHRSNQKWYFCHLSWILLKNTHNLDYESLRVQYGSLHSKYEYRSLNMSRIHLNTYLKIIKGIHRITKEMRYHSLCKDELCFLLQHLIHHYWPNKCSTSKLISYTSFTSFVPAKKWVKSYVKVIEVTPPHTFVLLLTFIV